ncbi:type II toxin-antitoxin system Phd/YefM family antitoxin [Zoogloea sp.]|uniref:type II toxin-antitoxin system Phd/YefM family antitoxin n=1 Tax=Zoogloea sp. TaxID=49181 RepID=UPI00344E0FD9
MGRNGCSISIPAQRTGGLGPLSFEAQRGLYLHPVVSPEREPLGVTNAWTWVPEFKQGDVLVALDKAAFGWFFVALKLRKSCNNCNTHNAIVPDTLNVNVFIKGCAVSFTAQDVVPISEARARLTELADDVVSGAEKLLTKNGAAYVALVDAKKLDYYHALEEEHASLVLLTEAEAGLREVLAGHRVSNADLMKGLS